MYFKLKIKDFYKLTLKKLPIHMVYIKIYIAYKN